MTTSLCAKSKSRGRPEKRRLVFLSPVDHDDVNLDLEMAAPWSLCYTLLLFFGPFGLRYGDVGKGMVNTKYELRWPSILSSPSFGAGEG